MKADELKDLQDELTNWRPRGTNGIVLVPRPVALRIKKT